MNSIFRLALFVATFFTFSACKDTSNEHSSTKLFSSSHQELESYEESNMELLSIFDKDLDLYFGYLNNHDYENMFAMTIPKLFEVVSRQTMENMFKSLYESGLEMKVEDVTPISLSQIVKNSEVSYCKIQYQGVLTMTLSQTLMANIELFKAELYKSHKKENIQIRLEENQIVIDAEQYIIASSSDEERTWKYFELQEGQEDMLVKVIPAEVLSQFHTDQ